MLAKSRRYRRVLRGDWVSRSFNASILPQHFISDALCKFFSLCKSKPSKSLVGCFILSISLPAFLTGPKKDLSSNLFSSAVGTSSHEGWENGAKKEKKNRPWQGHMGDLHRYQLDRSKDRLPGGCFSSNDSKHYTPNVVGKNFFLAIPTIKKSPPTHTIRDGSRDIERFSNT